MREREVSFWTSSSTLDSRFVFTSYSLEMMVNPVWKGQKWSDVAVKWCLCECVHLVLSCLESLCMPPLLGCPPYCLMSSSVPEKNWCFRVSQDNQASVVCPMSPAPKHNLKEQEKLKWPHFPWNTNFEPEFPINVRTLVCTCVGAVCVSLCYMCIYKIIKWVRTTIIYLFGVWAELPTNGRSGDFFPHLFAISEYFQENTVF